MRLAQVFTPTSPKVLWTDDHIDKMSAFVRGLRNHGFDVTTANSEVTAIEFASQRHFNMFLVDVRMQGMGGIELLRKLHDIESNAIFVTVSSFLYSEEYVNALNSTFAVNGA